MSSSSMTDWRCPECGERLLERQGRLYCEGGDMVLAERVSDYIRATPARQESTPPSGHAASGGGRTVSDWYCPWCGSDLAAGSGPGGVGDRVCRGCGHVLAWPYRYALVELHSHRGMPRPRRSLGARLKIKWARVYLWLRWGV